MSEVIESSDPYWDRGYRITNILSLDIIVNNLTFHDYTRMFSRIMRDGSNQYCSTGGFFALMPNDVLSYYLNKKPNDFEINAVILLLARSEGELEVTNKIIEDCTSYFNFLVAFEAACRINFVSPSRVYYSIFSENINSKSIQLDKPMQVFYNAYMNHSNEGLNQEVKDAIKEIHERKSK